MAYPQAWNSSNAAPIPKDGTPTWLPVIPLGKFQLQVADPDHPGQFKMVEVDIKREWLDEMVANFKDGFPTSLGVPVNERADHSTNPEGAYAYYADLKFDEAGEYGPGVYGLFTPTEYGKPVIASGSMPYTSPRLTVGDYPDAEWGRRNICIAAALTPLPQFGGQPHMILASAQTQDPTAASAAADTTHGGVMAMTPEELQAKIDEAIAAAKATWEQEQADALTALTEERDGLKTQLDEMGAKLTEAEATAKRVTEIEGELQRMKDERDFAAVESELSKPVEVKRILPDGATQVDIMAPTPEAVQIAASARTNPNAETVKALTDHMAAHGGSLELMTVTEGKPALTIAASAPGAALPAPGTEAELQAALAGSPKDEQIRALMAEGSLTYLGAFRKLAADDAGL
ncbi:MAG TPA: hypothetical protein VM238_05555 [Phycisphaerae bacterium]|nr:hypothetical protein [Phycisphaerae bacterium]